MTQYTIYIFSLLMLTIQCGLPKSVEDYTPKYLESSDWFMKGKDRFYLAYADVDISLSADYPDIKGGNNFLFGIGCYNEPKDPNTLIQVPSSDGGQAVESIPLIQREKLYQFEEQLRSGQCEILLGNKENGMLILNNDHNKIEAEHPPRIWSQLRLGAVCGAIAAPVLGLSLVNDGAIALDFKAAMQNINELKSQVDKKSITKNLGSMLIMSTFLLSYLANGTWCYDSVVDRINVGIDFVNQSNRSLLFSYLNKAEIYADQRLAANPEKFSKYLKAMAESEFEIATSIYNPIFVRAFNRNVKGSFKQGFSIKGKSKQFFDSVKTMQTEMNRQFGKNFHSEGVIPANYVQCSEEQIRECSKSGELSFSCFRKTCLNLKSILSETTPTLEQ